MGAEAMIGLIGGILGIIIGGISITNVYIKEGERRQRMAELSQSIDRAHSSIKENRLEISNVKGDMIEFKVDIKYIRSTLDRLTDLFDRHERADKDK